MLNSFAIGPGSWPFAPQRPAEQGLQLRILCPELLPIPLLDVLGYIIGKVSCLF